MKAKAKMFDVAVVGGGLAGLAAAAYAARSGLSVVVAEKSEKLGGRAVTRTVGGGFRFNVGAHALYRRGAGAGVLRELGVKFAGGVPSTRGAQAVHGGEKFLLPGGFLSLLRTGLLGLPAKFETARLLAALPRLDTAPLQAVTLQSWMETALRREETAQLFGALTRVTTYSNDAARASAGATLDQVKLGLTGGVYYLDGGWQTLVDGLRDAAAAAGATIMTGAGVASIETEDGDHAVRLPNGETLRASRVVLAVEPDAARRLVNGGGEAVLSRWADESVAIRAACLDVALTSLPRPRDTFALGVDRPLYLSVHSATARLAPEGGAVIHLLKYLSAEHDNTSEDDRRELEDLLDLVQPGWRGRVAAERFMPRMTVSNALVTKEQGGLAGRPGPEVPGLRGVYVAGDWVGGEGMLADASLASARRAAQAVTRDAAVERAPRFVVHSPGAREKAIRLSA